MFKIISASFLQILLIVDTFAISQFDQSLPREFHTNIDNVQSALYYMKNYIEDVNLDAYFGVLLAKVYLESIDIKDTKLQDTLNLAKRVLKTRYNKSNTNKSYYLQNIEKYVMNEDKWKSIISNRNMILKCNSQMEAGYLNFEHLRNSLLSFDTSPNESESDMCLSEIITVTKKLYDGNKSCPISKICYNAMVIGPSKGYAKTHRLLYFIICRIEGCIKCGGIETSLAIEELCCSIMAEASAIEESGFEPEFRDLFMEQVTLCAVAGYTEVLKPRWIESINEWQRPEGCWGYYNNRIRRSTNSLGSADCSSHATGLGVSTLSLAAFKTLG